MKKVILDTNFLMDLVKFKINLENIDDLLNEPYKLFTLTSVIEELKSLKENKNAKAALRLIEEKNIKIIGSEEKYVDKLLLNLADNDTIVSTNDRELRKKLKEKGAKVIYLRARKYLAIG